MLQLDAHRKEASRHNTRSSCQHDGSKIFRFISSAQMMRSRFEAMIERFRRSPLLTKTIRLHPQMNANCCRCLVAAGLWRRV